MPTSAESDLELGLAAGQRKDHDVVLERLTRVLPQAAQLPPEVLRSVHVYLGIAHAHAGTTNTAWTHANEALKLLEQYPDPAHEVEVKYNLAHIKLTIGNYSDALEDFFAHLKLVESYGLPLRARTLDGIANAYDLLGQLEQGILYHKEALAAAIKDSDKRREGIVLGNLGASYKDIGNYAEAIQCLQKAVAASKQVGIPYDLCYNYYYLGELYSELGQVDPAISNYQLGLDVLKAHRYQLLVACIHVGLVKLLSKHRPSSDLKGYLEIALAAAEEIQNRAQLEAVHLLFSDYHENLGEFGPALAHHKLHSKYKLEHLQHQFTMRTQTLMVQLDVEKTKREQERLALKNTELESTIVDLEERSSRDSLTGLYNRRYFEAQLLASFQESSAENAQLCVMFADIDNFKKINDTFSHGVGDKVLRIVASIFLRELKGGDIVARYGGEEIVAFFVNTSIADTFRLCDRVRAAIQHYPWSEIADALSVTISIGVADRCCADARGMLDAADKHLYQAKATGKNKVVANLDVAPVGGPDMAAPG